MTAKCSNENCQVAQTGKCLLLKENLEECEFYLDSESDELDENDEPYDNDNVRERIVHSGRELGWSAANQLARKRYTRVIGVLGEYGAGKTCLLSALYCMCTNGMLQPTWRFAGSLTLQAFEDRARHARKWVKGGVPVSFPDHTFLDDDRNPGFLHICVKSSDHGAKTDLLFTDLPGEWTTDLIKKASNAERLEFFRRADLILIVVSAHSLEKPELMHKTEEDCRMLFGRLANAVQIPKSIPLVLVLSKADEVEMRIPEMATKIQTHANSAGFQLDILPTSAFSKSDKVQSGAGLKVLAESITQKRFEVAIDDLPMLGERMFARVGQNR